jgi:hypothetical protein
MSAGIPSCSLSQFSPRSFSRLLQTCSPSSRNREGRIGAGGQQRFDRVVQLPAPRSPSDAVALGAASLPAWRRSVGRAGAAADRGGPACGGDRSWAGGVGAEAKDVIVRLPPESPAADCQRKGAGEVPTGGAVRHPARQPVFIGIVIFLAQCVTGVSASGIVSANKIAASLRIICPCPVASKPIAIVQ